MAQSRTALETRMIPHYVKPCIAHQGFSVALLPDERRTLDLRRATVEWIAAAAPWRWFCTLTFAGFPSDDAAHDAFRRWARDLACDRSHVRIAWSYAPQYRGTLHYHALLAPDVQELVDPATVATWGAGRVDVQPVYDAQGAARYVTEHANDLDPHDLRRAWDLNVACDRRRRCRRRGRGCVVLASPWGHPT